MITTSSHIRLKPTLALCLERGWKRKQDIFHGSRGDWYEKKSHCDHQLCGRAEST